MTARIEATLARLTWYLTGVEAAVFRLWYRWVSRVRLFGYWMRGRRG